MLSGFRHAFELLYDAVLVVDDQMRIRYANSATSNMFGYPIDELFDNNIGMLVPDKLRGSHQQHVDHYVVAPQPRQMHTGKRLRARKKDGSEFPVSISLNSIPSENGTMFCAVVRDMSELAQVEAELMQKKKMESLGVIVGGVAHDINNIMAAIRGSIYLARRKPEQAGHS